MVGTRRWTIILSVVVVALFGAASISSAQSFPFPQLFASFYQVHNLVSDGFVPADHVDPDLVNPWGIAFNPYEPGFVWVADNATSQSTLDNGNKAGLVVTIPGGKPTNVLFFAAGPDDEEHGVYGRVELIP